ncbi:hypothetical protein BDR26DRAFT_905324 [Obelidium mucronatum]|nr:hypothetical protein BDR26DRAFT_905324 [Obelidium mucronatum]
MTPPTLFESLFQFATVLGPLLPYIGTSVGTLGLASFAQAVPRLGPLRAVWIASRSRFLQSQPIQSVRDKELQLLRKDIAEKNWGQKYIIVSGEKGVGKSCLIDTAVYKTCGIIRIKAQPGEKEKEIIENALRGLTGLRTAFWDPISNSRRVIFWYKLITLGKTPIVVISVTERKKEGEYAGVAGAVRTLTDDLHLRVIVDSSPNSLADNVTCTKRQMIYPIDAMTREMIWSLPQFTHLFAVTKRNCVDDILWGVFGGNPASYDKFWGDLKKRLDVEPNLPLEREIIGKLLGNDVSAAIDLVRTAKKAHTDMKSIIELFDKEKSEVADQILEERGLQQPTPDKVFRKICREVNGENVFFLVPSDGAVRIVLCHSLKRGPTTVDALVDLQKWIF